MTVVATTLEGPDQSLEHSVRSALRDSQGFYLRLGFIKHLHPGQDELADGSDLAIVLRGARFQFTGHHQHRNMPTCVTRAPSVFALESIIVPTSS